MIRRIISLFVTTVLLLSLLSSYSVSYAVDSDGNFDSAIPSKQKIDIPIFDDDITEAVSDTRAIDTSVIALGSSKISVVEGGTATIAVTANSSNALISWSSSDTSVASISTSNISRCTIKANKAGKTEIVASVTVNGTVYTASCTVYVNIANGVYYIKNVKSGHYVKVQNGKILSGTTVEQALKHLSSASLHVKTCQMWKIFYLGDGRYSVRPMHKLDMGLDVTSGKVDIYGIGTNDTLSGVPSYAEWSIEYNTNGYVFKLSGVNTNTMKVTDSSSTVGASLVTGTFSATDLSFKWTLEPISSPPSGLILYDTSTGLPVTNPTRYVAPEETRTLSNLKLAIGVVSPTSIAQTATWTAFGYADVNSSTGSATGLIAGTTTVTATANNSSVTYTLKVTEIPNGVYLIKNRQTGYYTDIQGPTMANGTKIHQWIFHGGKSQKWTFTHVGDGYYSIKTTYSSASYYLGVINDSTTVDVDVVLRNGSVTDGMKWRVETTTDGAVKLVPKTGSTYALATTTSSATNGAKLIQGAYVNNTSYRDEWYLHQVKDFSLVYLGEGTDDDAMVLQVANALNDL